MRGGRGLNLALFKTKAEFQFYREFRGYLHQKQICTYIYVYTCPHTVKLATRRTGTGLNLDKSHALKSGQLVTQAGGSKALSVVCASELWKLDRLTMLVKRVIRTRHIILCKS